MIMQHDVLDVLTIEDALIVHFSGTPPMHHRPGVIYPNDLQATLKNDFGGLSCSIVLPNDSHQNAIGRVGLILKPESNHSILYTNKSDAGSGVVDFNGFRSGAGQSPSRDSCLNSIRNRASNGYNEWGVKDYSVAGVFVFFPIEVWSTCTISGPNGVISTKAGKQESIETVAGDFPGLRLITVHQGKFWEVDAQANFGRCVDAKSIYI